MEQRQDAKPAERPAKADRAEPQPAADRRRLMRPKQKEIKPGQVFTDWASI